MIVNGLIMICRKNNDCVNAWWLHLTWEETRNELLTWLLENADMIIRNEIWDIWNQWWMTNDYVSSGDFSC